MRHSFLDVEAMLPKHEDITEAIISDVDDMILETLITFIVPFLINTFL
jgi:hypothetical protein